MFGRLKTWLPRSDANRRRTRKPGVRCRPQLDRLSDRITPAVIDLLTHPSTATVNGGIFTHMIGVPGGGGGTAKFLSIDSNNTPEQGYNTTAAFEFETKSPTRVFRLNQFETINVGGVVYKEIILDVNESGNAGHAYLSLNDVRIYAASVDNLSGYNPVTHTLGGQAPLYDLDGVVDNTILLDGVGGGANDMFFLVPVSAFAGAGLNPFVYLFSRLGDTTGLNAGNLPPGANAADFAADDGDETWSAPIDSLYPRADLAVTKTDFTATEVPGTPVTYTITVRNNGPTTVTSFTFSDVIPPEIVLGSVVFGAPSSGALHLTLDVPTRTFAGTWDGITLATGQSVTVTLTAMVDPLATGTMTNRVSVFTPPTAADPNLTNNTATDTDTLTPQVDLSITKDDHSLTEVPGTPVTYDISISNAGPSTVTSVHLSDVSTPILLNLNGTLPPGATFDPGTGILSGIMLAAGDTISGTLTGDIPSSATGTLTNTATVAAPPGVTDTVPGNNTATDVDTLTAEVDLRITKTDTSDIVFPGQALAYTITVDNLGPSDVTGASVNDIFPIEISSHAWFVLFATPGASAAPASGGTAANLLSSVTIPAGGVLVFQVDRIIDPTLIVPPGGLLLSNTAFVAAPVGVTDTNPANNSSTHNDLILPNPTQVDLNVVKSHVPEPAVPGQTVTYTITVTNEGPIAVTAATVLDSFFGAPGLAAFTSLSWTATILSPGSVSYNTSGSGALSDTVDLPVFGFITYTVLGTIDPFARGNIANMVEIFTPAGITDTHTADNRAFDLVILAAQTDLAVAKTHIPEPAVPGQSVDFTITVTNEGPSAVTSINLADVIPADLTLVGAFIPAVGTYDSVTGIWTGLTLAPLDTVTMTFTAAIDPGATGTHINTVTVQPIGAIDIDQSDNTAQDPVTLAPQVDVSVVKDDGVNFAIPGTITTYSIVVRNTGPSDAINVLVADTFPPALYSSVTWTSTAAGGATGNQLSGTGDINDTIDLPVGSSVTYTVTARINPAAVGLLVNTAIVTVPRGITDTSSANNIDDDIDVLVPTADLLVRKAANRNVVTPGSTLTYVIRVTNLGPSTVTSFVLTDTFPPGFTPTSFTPSAGVFDPASGNWTGLNLAAGQSVTLRITGRVSTSARGRLINRVRVDPPPGLIDPNLRNNFARLAIPVLVSTPASKRWFFF